MKPQEDLKQIENTFKSRTGEGGDTIIESAQQVV